MELEILRLIYDYSAKQKLVDQSFFDKLVEIVVRGRNLNDYVGNVTLSDEINSTAQYNVFRKRITINYTNIMLGRILQGHLYGCLFERFEKNMFLNMISAQTVLHELEHAYQQKQADNKNDNSIQTKLMRATFFIAQYLKNPNFEYMLNSGELSISEFEHFHDYEREMYHKYYSLCPCERLAEIYSFSTLKHTLEDVKNIVPNLYEFILASQAEQMLKGYKESWEEGICPTEVYLSKIGQSRKWTEFDFYSQDPKQLVKNINSQYSLSERLVLGLPVSYGEYDNTYGWLEGTNKYSV